MIKLNSEDLKKIKDGKKMVRLLEEQNGENYAVKLTATTGGGYIVTVCDKAAKSYAGRTFTQNRLMAAEHFFDTSAATLERKYSEV